MLNRGERDNERELRRMSRAQLIDVIYALKTTEVQLRSENEELKARLQQQSKDAFSAQTLDALVRKLAVAVAEVRAAANDCRKMTGEVHSAGHPQP